MVKLNKIYTRTGDDGSTGLANGERRAKCDSRVEAYGDIDETNSFIGLARLSTAAWPELDALNARLTPLTSFILPGGSSAAAALHLARTVSRRAERRMVALSQEGEA